MIIIGHRGAAGYEPENTLRSFEKAIILGVDMIEIDVRRCKSGELVIMHDDSINRTTNGKGKISELDLDSLQKLDAGKGEHIPTLTETIQFINRRAKVDIEIKEDNIATDVAKIINSFISQGWQNSDFLVTSRITTEVQTFRKINPSITIGVIIHRADKIPTELAQSLKAEFIFLPEIRATKRTIHRLQSLGFKVSVYTHVALNYFLQLHSLKRNGIDAITSNKPDLI